MIHRTGTLLLLVDDDYIESVEPQSPGSRSAPWVACEIVRRNLLALHTPESRLDRMLVFRAPGHGAVGSGLQELGVHLLVPGV